MDRTEGSLTDRIRARCREVASTAGRVQIIESRLDEYADELSRVSARVDPGDPVHLEVGDDETRCLFVLALDAINFGSGWFPVLDKRPGLSGYHTVAAGLADHVRSHGLDVTTLRQADQALLSRVTGQRGNPSVNDLTGHFARSWNLLGELLTSDGDRSAMAFVARAEGSAVTLASLLADGHPMYRDEPLYRAEPVPLFKRAQITAADLHHTFGGAGPGAFHDLDDLTMFADNLVPHVLRLDGLLTFHPELVARLRRGDLLAPGEPAEVEIRAVAVHAVELLVARINRRGGAIDAMTLDGLLWHRGAGDRYKATPRHRCRTTAY